MDRQSFDRINSAFLFRHARRLVLVALAVAAAALPRVLLANSHPFNVNDLLRCQRISGPQVAPRGDRMVFVVRTTDIQANRGRTDLWIAKVNGEGARRLTTHEASDSNPQWSADGWSVYFLSSRSGSSQIWRIAIDGGEAEQVTNLPLDISTFKLSPDGQHFALAMEVFRGTTVEATVDRLAEEQSKRHTGRVYDKLFVRHWDTWKDGRRSHIFVMPVTGGKPVNVMSAMEMDCPTKPFGDSSDFVFAPDGRSLVLAARKGDATEPWSTNFDLYHAPADGHAMPRNMTKDNPAWDAHPTFSPDGRMLAWVAMKKTGYEADRFQIMVKSWPDGKPRELAADWDRSVRGMLWSAMSRELIVTAAHLGQTALFAIDVTSGKVRTLVESGSVGAVRTMGTDHLIFSKDDLSGPSELFRIALDGGEPEQITRLNDSLKRTWDLGDYEQFTFKGWNGETVHGYVLKPADFEADRKYPVAFLIHGGPQGSFGNHWHYRWNPQVYAGRGYGAVFIDFHGSTGYGQAFTDSIRGDWGGKPLEDLQKGLSAALQKFSWLDGERVGALGASYGGYMINWIAGNWPDRFRCLVNHDGVFNTRMMYFVTEELWFPEWENHGTPWAAAEHYRRNNPIEHIDKWQTPMLVIHGALDYRVVDTEGLAAFTACQRRGIPSKLLYFPDENHWVLKPINSIQWHDTVLDWLDEWCKKGSNK